MKITFVLPTANMSGGIRVLAIYADRLRQRGHDVFVVSQPPRRPTLRDRLRRLRQGLGWRQPAEGSHFDHFDVPHKVLKKRRPVADADVPDADVVVATWWETAEWVWKLSPAKGSKVHLIQGHETVYDPRLSDRIGAVWRLPMHKITVSRWLSDIARDVYGVDGAVVVHNGVDLDHFSAPPRGRQAKPTVGFVYSAVAFKGTDLILQAIDRLRGQFPELQVVSFGADEVVKHLPLPAGAQYTRLPAQECIPMIYAQADVWLCASRSEGFGLPLLEAMACRCPAVSSAVGVADELIQPGVNGYIVPVGDFEHLAARAADILHLPDDQWQRMSQAAWQATRGWTWDEATNQLEAALIDAAIQSKPEK